MAALSAPGRVRGTFFTEVQRSIGRQTDELSNSSDTVRPLPSSPPMSAHGRNPNEGQRSRVMMSSLANPMQSPSASEDGGFGSSTTVLRTHNPSRCSWLSFVL
jgi:hypothetical protein